jgi:hypothetical protein
MGKYKQQLIAVEELASQLLTEEMQMAQDFQDMDDDLRRRHGNAASELKLAQLEIKAALNINPCSELRTALMRVSTVYESMWNGNLLPGGE